MAEQIELLVGERLEEPSGRTLQKTDAEIEAEIGKLVYELYGLTDEEIRLVEESVDR